MLQSGEDRHYVHSTASVDDRRRVLKDGETFGLFDRFGDIAPHAGGELGLYHEGTRYLSQLALRIDGRRPAMLSSTVVDDNALLAVDLTNTDVETAGRLVLPRGSVHLFRSKFLTGAVAHERLRLHNFGLSPLDFEIEYEFDADYRDIFEVRGSMRERRGKTQPPVVDADRVRLSYLGLDGVTRATLLVASPAPSRVSARSLCFRIHLQPNTSHDIHLFVGCEHDGAHVDVTSYEPSLDAAGEKARAWVAGECHLRSSNAVFDEWVDRSLADLRMMVTETSAGPYPYAGVPWYSTVFGRDGLLTAMQALWVKPDVAKGVLRYLARTQAEAPDDARDAEPGKILHERRSGEMAALGEIPFGRYYGTVDATPLFVMLAGDYFAATGDGALVREIWPNVRRALDWLERSGDADGDGFVEYARRRGTGLRNQGWKDSFDAVFHEDGTLAEGPIALCEVQAYAYGAWRAAASLAPVCGDEQGAREWGARADRLRERFEATFWCDDLGTYALALDGEKRTCRVRASNAGHCLWTGIASPERAARIAADLCGESFFSGWGIRTVATGEARFNPMAYHNGSIWPHDNALCAAGFARYGHKDAVIRTFTALFEASAYFDLHRMPELFCGFPRRPQEGPTLYPVACAPQAWAAGAVLMLLQASLGLRIDALAGRVTFERPVLPPFLDFLELENLQVGAARIDLRVHSYGEGASVDVLRRTGDVRVAVES